MNDKQIRLLLDYLNGTYLINIITHQGITQDKLEWLADDDRDFLKITPELIKTAEKELKKRIEALPDTFTERDLHAVLDNLGDAVLAHIVKRFRRNTEYPMRPLSPEYVKKKGHSRIGILSGDLLKDLLNSETKVVKK